MPVSSLQRCEYALEVKPMLKSYEAFYENGKLNWLGAPPPVNKVKVLVVVEEDQ